MPHARQPGALKSQVEAADASEKREVGHREPPIIGELYARLYESPFLEACECGELNSDFKLGKLTRYLYATLAEIQPFACSDGPIRRGN